MPARFESLDEQLRWEQANGLVPVTDAAGTGTSGFARQQDLMSIQPGAPKAIPVYGATDLSRQVGVMTEGGYVDLATYNAPAFDVEKVILERWGQARLDQYRGLLARREAYRRASAG